VLRTARELGLTPVMWNVTAYDWEATDPQDLAARVRRGLLHNRKRHRGTNLLLHDGGHRELSTDRSITLSAVGLLLEGWAGSGLRFVTVDAWG
jgi:peptidoglycan/xylan/chitin deacetylase (PgdA/CDA1 family)